MKAKFTILGHHMAISVQIWPFEAQNFDYLRVILGNFLDTKHQELPGAWGLVYAMQCNGPQNKLLTEVQNQYLHLSYLY